MAPSPRNRADRKSGIFEWFVHSEVAGSVVLAACTLVALAWANSPWADVYFRTLHTQIGVSWGGATYALSAHHWINDGLMAVFFFVVGLEMKRELLVGHLSTWKKAVLPVIGAAGGMLVPALLFATLNFHGPGARGWGVPMATDIAFALGLLAVFGKRVPIGLKVFLTAAAIADDIGAVLVIAIFYTEAIHVGTLVLAGLLLALLYFVARVLFVRRPSILLVLIVAIWLAVFASGVHATVAGVLVALVVPMRAEIDPGEFFQCVEDRFGFLRGSTLTTDSMIADRHQLDAIADMHEAIRLLEPAGIALEHYLHPVQAFFVLPLFALANAGVAIDSSIGETLLSPVGRGIILGLFLGKQVGITLLSWLAVRFGRAALPEGTTWTQLWGASCIAGIGFTMSLFVSELAFADEMLVVQAKLAILAASLLSAIFGAIVLQRALP